MEFFLAMKVGPICTKNANAIQAFTPVVKSIFAQMKPSVVFWCLEKTVLVALAVCCLTIELKIFPSVCLKQIESRN